MGKQGLIRVVDCSSFVRKRNIEEMCLLNSYISILNSVKLSLLSIQLVWHQLKHGATNYFCDIEGNRDPNVSVKLHQFE